MANTLNLGDGNWATKEDSLLGYNSENNNYKPLPFDFSRGSSATRINKNGLIETVGSGEPRIDFSNDTKGALLLEPTRTNLFLNSEPTSNENASGGITYESFNWFLGFSNCIKFGDDSSLRYRYGATVSATTQHTISAFVIMDDLSEPLVGVSSVTGDFAFVCGGVTGGVANENIYYGNNIYRVSTTLNAGTNANNSGIIKYTSQSSKGFRVVGLQIEQGGYATSYIPTVGSAVTRSADTNVSQNTPSGIIGQTEGSVFINVDVNSKVLSSSWAFSLNDGTTSNYIGLRRSGGAEFFVHINVSGTTTALIATGITSGNNKISIGYKFNDIVVYVNGVNVGIDTSSGVPLTNKLQIGDLISNRILEDSVSDFKLYNTRLSNAELQALTQ